RADPGQRATTDELQEQSDEQHRGCAGDEPASDPLPHSLALCPLDSILLQPAEQPVADPPPPLRRERRRLLALRQLDQPFDSLPTFVVFQTVAGLHVRSPFTLDNAALN